MNPIIILLLTLFGLSNATFFGLGGGEGQSGASIKSAFQAAPAQNHGPSHARPQIIKVILQTDNHGAESHGHGGGHHGHAEYIKVIHESAGHGYGHDSHGHGYGHDSHGHGSGSNSNSKILSLLPQILQIVLADESHGKHGGQGGHGSSFFSTVSKGADFYRGGHVIEKGTLELKKIPNAPSSGGQDKAALLSALPALLNGGGKGGQQSGGWSSSSGSSGWSSGSSGWNSGW